MKIGICIIKQHKWIVFTFLVTFLVLLPALLHDTPGSLYFFDEFQNKEHLREILLNDNSERASNARIYLSALKRTNVNVSNLWNKVNRGGPHKHSVALCIVSKGRPSKPDQVAEYLTQTVAGLLRLVEDRTSDLPYRLQAFVCNIQSDSVTHTEAMDLESFIPVHSRVNHVQDKLISKYTKHGLDHAWCLNQSTQMGTDFVLMVEDDTIPKPDMLNILAYAIQQITMSHSRDEVVNRTEQIAWVKLFHGTRYLGFISLEPNRLPELFSLGVVLGSVFTALARAISMMCRSSRVHISYYTYWIISSIYITLVLLAIGRQSLLSLRSQLSPSLYLMVPAPKYFSPAMLYTSQSARSAGKFLETCHVGPKYPTDAAIYDFAKQSHLNSYYVEPNAFSHIGLISTLHKSETSPLHFIGQ